MADQGHVKVPWVARPSMQELPKMHQELGLWMAHTRYQVQSIDQIPVWRVQNTSITLSTGAGVSSFFLFRRLAPGLRFPIDIIPPFITFYLTHRAVQVWQLPGLYDSFLSLSSPLGFKAREILESIRNKGRLPSDEFGKAYPAAPGAPGARSGQERSAPDDAGVDRTFGSVYPAGNSMDSATTPPPPTDVAFPETPAPLADPWQESMSGGGDLSSGGGDPWGPAAGAQSQGPPRRRTWDEIRAHQAARQERRADEQ